MLPKISDRARCTAEIVLPLPRVIKTSSIVTVTASDTTAWYMNQELQAWDENRRLNDPLIMMGIKDLEY